ncbi:MAG: hypothetical protein J6J13_03640 [Clostridia bacterium]|nr:hypothetical protein [Clostridia bacterium]
MKKIYIADKTLCREENVFSFKEKLEIARQLEKLDVDVIEIPAIENVRADLLFVKTISSFVKDNVISVNSGMSIEGVENAAAALSAARRPRIRVELPVSKVGIEYICHRKQPKMIELVNDLVAAAKERCSDVEFCAVDATRAEEGFLKNIIETAVNAGANAITVCDSAAEIMPDDFACFAQKVSGYIENDDIQFGVSIHNKNGLACASAVLAVQKCADIVKATVGGEEVPLDTFVNIIKNCGNSYGFSSDINYTEVNRIIKQIDWITGKAKNEKSAVVVSNDEKEIKLNANDDRATVTAAVSKLGYDLSEDDNAKVYEEFLRVAAKKSVGSKELEAIVASVALQVEPTYKLVSYVINNGNIIPASAQIRVSKGDMVIDGVCIGDGPIDAAFLAIEQIIGHHYELDDFQIQSVTEGKEAMGSALVKLRSGGKLYSGNGISTDIIGASIRAYINAVNKIVYEEV